MTWSSARAWSSAGGSNVDGSTVAGVLAAGLLAGFVHVYAGPDHLAALGPLAMRSRRSAWMLGLRWGLGHSTGVLLVGALALLLRSAIDLERLSFWSERLVGVMLIVIGLLGCRALLRTRVHAHAHRHDDGHEHVHFHLHAESGAHAGEAVAAHDGGHRHTHAAFYVGTLHGAAGTSHLAGILPALLLPSRSAAILYLACFCAGTVTAMISFTHLVGWWGRRAAGSGDLRIYRGLLAASSIAACVIGLVWLMAPVAGIPLR
jgi:ABC-type nickel/cobalt efflux system permease component RcnA